MLEWPRQRAKAVMGLDVTRIAKEKKNADESGIQRGVSHTSWIWRMREGWTTGIGTENVSEKGEQYMVPDLWN